jgi:glycine cleavage system H lipoate-binding protein
MRDVLLVEDDRMVLVTARRLCGAEGFDVDEAGSVDEAFAVLERHDYRLALVDLMLPGKSGFDLLEALVAGRSTMPVVMISGYSTAENALRSLRLGAFDFLPKPFDLEELLGMVRRGLRYGRWREAAAGGAVAPGDRHYLGRHSWAALDAEGTATVGAGETFVGVLGPKARIELPAAGDHATQGLTLARVESADEVHRIRSPLSGRVVAANRELIGAIDLVDRSPFERGWLARIVPADPENELTALTSRPTGRDPAGGG